MGIKKMARAKSAKARLPSNSKNATVNRAGGVSFEINDATTKLIIMTGAAFFAEPKFYNADLCVPKRDKTGKLGKLVERLEIVEGKLKGFVSCDELPETAREVLATAIDVAKGQNPEDILIVANWLRNEMNIRLTPQVLLVLASHVDTSKSMVRRYATSIVRRPDEVKTGLLVHRFLFGWKSLPNGLAIGLGDALAKFGERGLMKYDDDGFPTWKDVLCWLPRKGGWPLKPEVATYFKTGNIIDPAATPIISARKELTKKTDFDKEAQTLAYKSMVNWEVLLSQFGKDKTAVWSFLVKNGLVGYMALLRNMRNILEAKVSQDVIQMVSDKLSNHDEVVKSKQLPFRFFSAMKALEGMEGGDLADTGELMAAIELASNEACSNMPRLPGTTVIFADVSQSMIRNMVSEKSTVSCRDAAVMLCGIVAKVADRPYVVAFGTRPAPVKIAKTDSVIGIAKKAMNAETYGCATNGHKCVEWMIENKLVPDRVIFLSDMQMWNSSQDDDAGKSLADVWGDYLRTAPGAKNTWVHCVHVNGYGDNVLQGDRVNMVAGFSEKVFTTLLQTEGVLGAQALPTVDQIREKWTVK
jgi:60 kDa SS-A/Ro ribonucleoprotein